ncbi:integral membrane sensor signal transduction histidine kinase [Pseudomonas sp. M47T1]|uniref:sensor histidine kinase n=1 Tax=unclassified Pseudomonas TaxID=196821 RepID=UPI0002608347|nr:sensor histidine kinase [Pseudomonas sp. M47T1]EIK93964.1 integral membrane sensor signal transduction histidine kinase [Pseudomonas sp. M47T1]
MKSIQGRLSVGLITVLVVVGVAVAQVGLWLFEVGLQRYLEAGLRNESESLLVALVRGPNGLQLDDRRISPAYERPFSGHYFRVDFGDGHWRSRSLWDQEFPLPETTGLHAGLTLGPEGQSLLVLRADYRRLGHDLSISVAQDYTPVRDSFQRMQRIGLGMGLVALLLILVLQRLTVKRALRPLERVREQIAQLQQGQRSQLDTQVPVELEPLVAQVNHLLAHTEDSLSRSRHALGNLGHALKTPMAVLFSLVAGERLAGQRELAKALREQLEQIEQRLGRELNRARLAGDALPGQLFDCETEVAGLVATLRMIHGQELAIICNQPPGLKLPWDREDLLEVLGNLLDNACKWADSEVRLTLVAHGRGYVLEVDDDGPGIPQARRDEVLNRGARLDEQVSGHGLGLGIVRDIVDAWGGTLALLASPQGGLRVRIGLPRRAIDPCG